MVSTQTRIRLLVLSVALFAGGLSMAVPRVANAQVASSKRCGGCGAEVSLTSRVGHRCPHCGAVWTHESNDYYESGSANNGYERPPNPMQVLALYLAVLEQERRLIRDRKHQARSQHMRQLRGKLAEKRKENYRHLEELTKRFRESYDPQECAQGWLATAMRLESDGNLLAAKALYRLVARKVPDTATADLAQRALHDLEE